MEKISNLKINTFLLNKILKKGNYNIGILELYFKLKKNKFDSLDKMILNNNFLLNEQKWVLLNIFSKYQKTLFSLS